MEITFNRLKEDCLKKESETLTSFMDHRASLYPWTNPWVESTLNRMKSTNDVEKSIDGDHEGKVEDDESDVKRISSSQFASGRFSI